MPLLRALPFLLVFALIACGGSEPEEVSSEEVGTDVVDAAAKPSVLEIVQGRPPFTVLATALAAADLEEALSGDGPITLFAPSNDAFSSLPQGASVDVLTAPANQALLRQILSYHLVDGLVPSTDLQGAAATITTVEGSALSYDGTGPVLTVGTPPATALVIVGDIEASNGVIHIIDAVLLPTE